MMPEGKADQEIGIGHGYEKNIGGRELESGNRGLGVGVRDVRHHS
jgi:hypothetical protein